MRSNLRAGSHPSKGCTSASSHFSTFFRAHIAYRSILSIIAYACAEQSLYYIVQAPATGAWGTGNLSHILCHPNSRTPLGLTVVGSAQAISTAASAFDGRARVKVVLRFLRDVDRDATKRFLQLSSSSSCTSPPYPMPPCLSLTTAFLLRVSWTLLRVWTLPAPLGRKSLVRRGRFLRRSPPGLHGALECWCG